MPDAAAVPFLRDAKSFERAVCRDQHRAIASICNHKCVPIKFRQGDDCKPVSALGMKTVGHIVPLQRALEGRGAT
jgi:hypothetical protein